MTTTIDITGIDKADLLRELYNHAEIKREPRRPMTTAEAQAQIAECQESAGLKFGFTRGRWLKVDITGDALDITPYEQENGRGKAQLAVTAAIHNRLQYQRQQKLKRLSPKFKF